ncbi:MAG: TolC family protein, partial [Rhodobacteraceae bacterium]|nr:TolC family protein [Paracoccaceae bacterium]
HASTDVSLKGRVLLYDGGVQKLAIGQTDSHLDIAELRLDSTIHQVMLDAIVAYHEVIKAQGFLNLAQNSLAVIEEEMEAARNRFRLGAIARTDISFVESRLAAARGDVQLREGELEIAREQFSFIVGEAPGRLATETRFPDLPASLEDALAIANQNSPALAIARKQVEIAEDDHERAERGLRFPRITFGGQTGLVNEFGSGGNTTRSAVFDITGSFTLSNGGAGQALLRQAAEQINSSRMNLRYQTNIVRQRVTNAWVRIEIARSNVTTAREQVEHTQLAFNGTRAEAALGARSTLDVLDAEQDYLQALTNQISAENDAVIAIYRLFGETGTLTPELLNLSVNPQ